MLLDICDVTKSYDMPADAGMLTVLRGVSLCVEAGETVAITGPSGTGKSTLLNIVGGLDHPTTGTISFQGRDISGLTDKDLSVLRNRDIGFVFQLHHLLPQCTVLENVLIPTIAAAAGGASAQSRVRAMALLERVGLAERAAYFPAHLSGGERQRVAVARALINRPALILADEPTGSLDGRTAADTGKLLVDLNAEENTALIVVTHSEELAGLMQRRYRLEEGMVIADR